MTKELFFIGAPFQFSKGLVIYPPTVNEVVTNKNFNIYVQLLTYSQEEIEDDFLAEKQDMDIYPTPFEYLLNNSYHNKNYEKFAIEAFELFTRQKVAFLYEAKLIVFGNLEEVMKSIESIEDLVVLNEDNFFDFQNLIRESIGQKTVERPDPKEHPKIKEMKRKARYRDKVKAKQKKNGGISLYTSMTSICCMGIGITPLNIGEMSFVAMNSLVSKYQDKEKFEIDIKSLLAGGDSKKIKPVYWIKNLEE